MSVLFVTVGMMLAGANMRPYTILYLLPAFFLWMKASEADGRAGVRQWMEFACWLMLLMPLQIPFGIASLNPVTNLAFMALSMLCFNKVKGKEISEKVRRLRRKIRDENFVVKCEDVI